MALTEERIERIPTGGAYTVDGVVRVRRIGMDTGPAKFSIEQREPVAVVIDRGAGARRIELPRSSPTIVQMAWVGIPLAAAIATRVARHRRKRGT